MRQVQRGKSGAGKFDAGTSGEGMPQDRTAGRDAAATFAGASFCASRCPAPWRRLLFAAPLRPPAPATTMLSSKQSFTDKFMSTLGLQDPFDPQYDINYSERSPLVVPPTRDLPPPQTANGPPAPNWPVDPEIKARAAAKQDGKGKPDTPTTSPIPRARCVRTSSMPSMRPAPTIRARRPSCGDRRSPAFLNFDWLKQEDYGTFTGEPPRVSLTDPPPGYQTPSPDQPYGIVPEKKDLQAADARRAHGAGAIGLRQSERGCRGRLARERCPNRADLTGRRRSRSNA